MISVNSAKNLYWLGRYIQRAETTAKECIKSFDHIIDKDFDDGKKLFEKLGCSIEYKDEAEFLREATFGKQDSSIYAAMYAMKENAAMNRALIYSQAFAYLNAAYLYIKELKKKESIEVFDLEKILSNLYGLNGVLDSTLIRTDASNFIEFGKRVERIDLEIRLYDNLNIVLFEIDELYGVAKMLSQGFEKPSVTTDDKTKLLNMANSLINSVIKF